MNRLAILLGIAVTITTADKVLAQTFRIIQPDGTVAFSNTPFIGKLPDTPGYRCRSGDGKIVYSKGTPSTECEGRDVEIVGPLREEGYRAGKNTTHGCINADGIGVFYTSPVSFRCESLQMRPMPYFWALVGEPFRPQIPARCYGAVGSEQLYCVMDNGSTFNAPFKPELRKYLELRDKKELPEFKIEVCGRVSLAGSPALLTVLCN